MHGKMADDSTILTPSSLQLPAPQGMSLLSPATETVMRGVALHKMVRLLTCALGGEAYLNFMGNEFGHPDWVDFPRPGNGHSFEKARRRWDLVDDPLLRYHQLGAFDAAMHALHGEYPWLQTLAPTVGHRYRCGICQEQQLIWFLRGELLFAFNFDAHAEASCRCTPQGLSSGRLVLPLLSSDEECFGGQGRPIGLSVTRSSNSETHGMTTQLLIQLPPQTCCVLHTCAHRESGALYVHTGAMKRQPETF